MPALHLPFVVAEGLRTSFPSQAEAGVEGEPPEWLLPKGKDSACHCSLLNGKFRLSPVEVTGHTKQIRKHGFSLSYTQGHFLLIGLKARVVFSP